MSAPLSRSFRSLIKCYIFRNDVIPTLSIGLIRDFRNVTVNLCHEKGMAERVIGKVLGIFRDYATDSISASARDMNEELWFWALLKTLRADMKTEKLYPPGQVYWINANTVKNVPNDKNTFGYSSHTGFQEKKSVPTTPISLHAVEDVEVAFSELAFSSRMFTDQ